jgi:hypothetical protein
MRFLRNKNGSFFSYEYKSGYLLNWTKNNYLLGLIKIW